MSPGIYATISVIRKMQYNLPKMRGGGGESKVVGNFSEKSSDLVARPFPNSCVKYLKVISPLKITVKKFDANLP